MARMKWRGTRKRGKYYAIYWEKVGGRWKKKWKRLCHDREAARKMFHELQSNRDRKGAGLAQSASWKEFLREYFKNLRTKREATTIERVDIIFRHLVRLFPIVDLTDITPKLVDDYMAARKEEGIDPSTINREFGAIRTAIKQAKNWSYEVHDLSTVEKMPTVEKIRHCFSTSEIWIMLQKADPLFRMVIRLGLYAGLRLADILGIRWVDIKWDEDKMVLGDGWRAKKGKVTALPLHPKLKEALKTWQSVCGSSEKVVPWDKTPHQMSGMFTHFLKKRCGIQVGSLHSLKHTFVTNLKRKNVSNGKIQKLARHEDLRTQDIYTHLEVEDLRDDIERLDFESPESHNNATVHPSADALAAVGGQERHHKIGHFRQTS